MISLWLGKIKWWYLHLVDPYWSEKSENLETKGFSGDLRMEIS